MEPSSWNLNSAAAGQYCSLLKIKIRKFHIMFPEPFIRPLRFSNYHWGPKQVVGQFDVADIRAGKGRPGAHIRWMTVRDRWTERLICRNCGNAGSAQLSAMDRFSWDARIDGVSDGFKAIKLEHGSDFYCSACNCLVSTQSP